MKRFQMITEADARVIEYGSTVTLVTGGHVTPLAADTLKARRVARGEADAGIAIDGAGLGSTIAANKLRGVRAAMCADRTLARYAREHNGANVLALGSTLVSTADALDVVDTFLGTPMREARYIRRLAKVRELERR